MSSLAPQPLQSITYLMHTYGACAMVMHSGSAGYWDRPTAFVQPPAILVVAGTPHLSGHLEPSTHEARTSHSSHVRHTYTCTLWTISRTSGHPNDEKLRRDLEKSARVDPQHDPQQTYTRACTSRTTCVAHLQPLQLFLSYISTGFERFAGLQEK
jgi:hypothetical protein